MLYLFTNRRLPEPGTGNLAFQPLTTLPAFEVGGPGTEYRHGFDAVGPSQLYYGQAQTLDGLAGISYAGMGSDGVIDFDAYLSNVIQAGEAQNG